MGGHALAMSTYGGVFCRMVNLNSAEVKVRLESSKILISLQVIFVLLFTQTTVLIANAMANGITTKFPNPSSENSSDRQNLIINGITGKITNNDWRKQVNEVEWPLNGWLSSSPTNVVRCKLFCRNGYHLQIRRNGVVSGTLNQNSKYSKCKGLFI